MSPRRSLRVIAALAAAAVLSCRARTTEPPPRAVANEPVVVTIPTVVASQPSVVALPPAHVEPPPSCRVDEHVVPPAPNDLAWVTSSIRALRDGASRSRLACLFGVFRGPNGSFAELTPHSPFFKGVLVFADHHAYRDESIGVRFVPEAQPLLADVERVTARSKPGGRHHPDTPETRIAYLKSDEGTSLRALLTMTEDGKRVAVLTMSMQDLRGWTPPPIRCYDGLSMLIFPPTDDRFEPGRYTIDVTGDGVRSRFTCEQPTDPFDVASCAPAGDDPPGAHLFGVGTSITVKVPGAPSDVTVEMTRDGVHVAKRTLHPRYSTFPASTGPCTTASETLTLRLP